MFTKLYLESHTDKHQRKSQKGSSKKDLTFFPPARNNYTLGIGPKSTHFKGWMDGWITALRKPGSARELLPRSLEREFIHPQHDRRTSSFIDDDRARSSHWGSREAARLANVRNWVRDGAVANASLQGRGGCQYRLTHPALLSTWPHRFQELVRIISTCATRGTRHVPPSTSLVRPFCSASVHDFETG